MRAHTNSKIWQRIVCCVALLACSAPAIANAQGLAERRAIKEYQDTKYPDLKKQIDAAAGFDVKVTPHWDKLAQPGEAENYLKDEYISDIFFYPLIEALKDITKDEMGKTALKEKLKEVVITYDSETAPISNYKSGWIFENGVLTINYKPWTNSDGRDGSNYKERVAALKEILEEKL